jgi:hypothetical protein
MDDKKFSGESLEEALREGTLAASRATTLTGMVKSSERAGYIGFTMAGCDTWVDLPSALIQSAASLGTSTCQDHSHPVMRITLKESHDPGSEALMALLSQVARPVGGMSASSPQPTYPTVVGPLQSLREPIQGFGRPAQSSFAPQLNIGGGFGGFGQVPTTCGMFCGFEDCGSALPGYPVPQCYICRYRCFFPPGGLMFGG